MNKNLKKILCIVDPVDANAATFIINILQPLKILEKNESIVFNVVKEKDALISHVLEHDIVFFFRNTSPALLKLMHFSKLAGKAVIYSVDDNFFELASSELGPMNAAELNAHASYIINSDLVMVYSDPMVERVRQLNEKVIKTVPGGIDFSVFEGLNRTPRQEKIKIIYATSRYKNDILSGLFLPALKRILIEYRGLVEMDIWGLFPKELEGLSGVNHAGKVDYSRYIRRLYSEGFDIGLAPLKYDLFHRSKTNTKFRDYGACGIAGIYSDVDVYSDCVEDGKTGLLVDNNEDAWYGAIKKLIEDEDLRESIKRNAYNYAKANYGMDKTADSLYNMISSVAAAGEVRKGIVIGNKLASRFLDLKPPKIVMIKTPEDGKMEELRSIMKIYGYPLKMIKAFKGSPRNKKSIAASDIIICTDSCLQRVSELTGVEKFKGITLSYNNGNILDIMNGIENYYYKVILPEGRGPVYCFSLKIISLKANTFRKFLGRYLFEKTRLKKIEQLARKLVRDPIREFFRKRAIGAG